MDTTDKVYRRLFDLLQQTDTSNKWHFTLVYFTFGHSQKACFVYDSIHAAWLDLSHPLPNSFPNTSDSLLHWTRIGHHMQVGVLPWEALHSAYHNVTQHTKRKREAYEGFLRELDGLISNGVEAIKQPLLPAPKNDYVDPILFEEGIFEDAESHNAFLNDIAARLASGELKVIDPEQNQE